MNRVRAGVLLVAAALAGGVAIAAYMAHQPPAPLPPLAPTEAQLARELEASVSTLAVTIGERNAIKKAALATAADWIASVLGQDGYQLERQPFQAQRVTEENVIATLPNPRSTQVVVVGAHYDTVLNSPGANDNGSGIAAMLAVAAALHDRRFKRELRFVAFANEEYGFESNEMGSRLYAGRCRARDEDVSAMLSLETMGYFSREPGSQRYPLPALGWLYPDRGDFLAVVGNLGSFGLAHGVASGLRARSPFPVQWASLPEAVPGATWSDHSSFWRVGYPAVMLTDTAPFRYNYYHDGRDTPDKLDYPSFARVVAALVGVVADLADAP